MNNFNEEAQTVLRVLATDLDGTLIPLPDQEDNRKALQAIRRAREEEDFSLIFVTGRHFESVTQARKEENLPDPDWIICDVGTSIYHRVESEFDLYTPYRDHLAELTGSVDRKEIERKVESLGDIALQAPDHQQEFKISFECDSENTERLGEEISRMLRASNLPFHATTSVDPFLHCGLIDLLPEGTSKAYALNWLSTHAGFHPDAVVFAGDSGNDLAALTSGFHAIVVANAAEGLAEKVREELKEKKLADQLYCSAGTATCGVLEGCVHFGLLPETYLHP